MMKYPFSYICAAACRLGPVANAAEDADIGVIRLVQDEPLDHMGFKIHVLKYTQSNVAEAEEIAIGKRIRNAIRKLLFLLVAARTDGEIEVTGMGFL